MPGKPLIVNNTFAYEHTGTFSTSNHAVPFQATVYLLEFNFKFSSTDDHIEVSCNVPKERIGWEFLLCIWIHITNEESNIDIVVEKTNAKLSSGTVVTLELPPNANGIHGLPQSLELALRMHFIEEKGLWPLIKPSVNFLADHDLANAVLIVDELKFFVNLDLLSIYSVYFAEKRTGGQKKVTLEVQGIKRDTMLIILKMIYDKEDLISDDNVEKIISATKLLKLETILSKCEKFLMAMESVEKHLSRLQLIAHTNDMSALHDFCHEKLYPTAVPIRPSSIPEVHSEAYSVPDIADRFLTTAVYKLQKRPTKFFGLVYSKTDPPPKEQLLLHVVDWWGFKKLKFALNWSIVMDWVEISLNSVKESAQMFQFDASNPAIEAKINIKNAVVEDVKIRVNWKINTIRGLRYFTKPVHKFSKGITSDIILQLADEMLFANLQILAHHSDFFRRLLAKKETLKIEETENLPIVDLGDLTSKELCPLLSQIYLSNEKIEDKNIAALLKLADRFLCTQVIIDCAEFLWKRENFHLETLQLAVEFHLEPVKNACLAKVQSSADLIQAIKTDPYWENIKEDAKVVLMDQILNME